VTRGRGRHREEVRTRVDPRQSYVDTRFGQHQRYHHANSRERDDITTFYFTRFPEHTTEKDLWAQFKKWGDVREVFISKHRNKGGRRYGFVRFKGVSDEHILERLLDNIIVGELKMYVNVPKYGRGKARSEEHKVKPRTQADGDNKEVEAPRQMATHCKATSMSYVKVVATAKTNVGQQSHPQPRTFKPDGSYSSIQLEIPAGERKWYTDIWVGRLKKSGIFERVEDELPWEIGTNVVPKYIGDDMILLLGLSDTKAEELIIKEIRHGTSPFHSLEKWNPTMRPGHRLVWAQCWSIPLEAWDIGQIRKIVAAIGDLVEVDDDSKSCEG